MPLGKTIVSEDNRIVTVTTDGTKERLDVEAKLTGSEIGIIPIGDRFNIVNVQSPGVVPTTLATRTVNVGKNYFIFGWRVNTAGAIYKAELQFDGVLQDSSRQDNSAFTSVATGTVNYGLVPLVATENQVVRIQLISGDTGKEFITFFWGIEIDN